MMHGFGFGPYGWIGMILSLVFWVVLLGGLVWLIVWAVRKSSGGNTVGNFPAAQSPKEMAQMRYARGEITREQYQQLVEDLSR
jgi:putative membrane protein